MAEVIIVGDGPGGLSAALFLGKNGQQVAVSGQDGTAMHFAYRRNYLGLPETPGSIRAREAGKDVQDWDTPPKS